MAMIGNGNHASEGKRADGTSGTGRIDLSIGFGEYVALNHSMVNNGGVTDDEIEHAYVQAAKSHVATDIIGGKPRAAQNILPALENALATAHRNAATGDVDAQREVGRLTGLIERISSSAEQYAAPLIRDSAATIKANTTGTRQDVERASSNYDLQRNVATDELNPVMMPDPMDPTRQIPRLNPHQNPDIRFGYEEQRDQMRGRRNRT